jgi:prepilin-type processing-associated H-X9-DG protein
MGVREKNTSKSACPGGPYNFKSGAVGNECDQFHYWSLHPNGTHFLFADGSLRFLQYTADGVLPALSTRASGEVPGDY